MKTRMLFAGLLAALLLLNLCACTPNQESSALTPQPEQTNTPTGSKPTTTAPTEPQPTEPIPTEPTATDPAEPVENFEFEVREDGTYRIKKYLLKKADHVILPEMYNGGRIVEIAQYAFNGTEIGTVTISKYIAKIDGTAFQSSRLVSFQVDEDNAYFCAVDGVLFSKNMAVLVRFPTMAPVTSYTICEGVSTIAFCAFSNCQLLESVALPNSLYAIESMAFSFCLQLSEIRLPDGLRKIGDSAFHCVEKMTEIYIPASVTSMGEMVFSNIDALTAIHVDPQNANYQSIDGVLFNKEGTALLEYPHGRSGAYTVPQTVLEIASESFAYSKVTQLILPDSLRKIGGLAFQGCDVLQTITYQGTTSQWEQIAFGYSCFSSCGAKHITCSDGKLSLE